MAEAKPFDPYHLWLGIPPRECPPNHYRLLGIPIFEHDVDVIVNAADRQMAYVRCQCSGMRMAEASDLLNKVTDARLCLLDSARKAAYDATLAADLPPLPGAVKMDRPRPPENGWANDAQTRQVRDWRREPSVEGSGVEVLEESPLRRVAGQAARSIAQDVGRLAWGLLAGTAITAAGIVVLVVIGLVAEKYGVLGFFGASILFMLICIWVTLHNILEALRAR